MNQDINSILEIDEAAQNETENKMAEETTSDSKAMVVVSLILTCLCLLWYALQVLQFGFAFDMIDLLGGYFMLNCIALVVVIRASSRTDSGSVLQFVACTLAIPASALFLAQFLSTFDPFYRVNEMIFTYLLRALFLGAAATTLAAMTPTRFFKFPKWLLVLVFLVTVGWIFVYACPSIVREWYGTRTAPSALFPDGMLIFDSKNPEREIQGQMLTASVVAWIVLIVVGRIQAKKAQSAYQGGAGND